METRAHYVLIGSFVLSAVAAAFLFILWLGQAQREFDEYDVIFTERVSGLSVGAAVRFNGIQKGEVEDLSIDPDNPSIVVARIRVDRDTPVKTDTVAELEPVGFTGLLIIQLVGGTAEAALLKEASEDRVPRIEANTSSIGLFLEGSGDVVAQAQRLLSQKNIEGIGNIIANLETATSVLAENRDKISLLIENANAVTENLASASVRIDAAAAGLQRLTEEDAPEALAEAEALMTETRALVAELRVVVGENRQSIRVFTDQGLAQVAPAIAEARRVMRTLDYMLREIDRNPRGYLLGESQPEYQGGEE